MIPGGQIVRKVYPQKKNLSSSNWSENCHMRFIGISIFYLQNMNATGFRACLKELYETRYDPVSVSYVVLAGQLARNVAFLM